MKRYSVIFTVGVFICIQVLSQQTIIDVTKAYYRSTPFDKEFSKFLSHLLNDPTLSNKTLQKRTDTSLFYFKGEYAQHNPFSFKAIRTEVILAETELQLADSIFQIDTILLYQLLGYTKGGKDGIDEVKKEYNKFNRKFGHIFSGVESKDLNKNNKLSGTISNYFVFNKLLSPLTIAWAELSESDENVFAITIRIKVRENISMLPDPEYDQ